MERSSLDLWVEDSDPHTPDLSAAHGIVLGLALGVVLQLGLALSLRAVLERLG
ncbi:MAG: hypothetical protein R3190_12760 [Thermoanaerobaculia bacterium]|nr:hypothetical protein [Thermoanaerobaculia bacterium]